MKIAILGATSQIAKDLIISFSEDSTKHDVCMFSRSPEKVANQFKVLKRRLITQICHIQILIIIYSLMLF